MAKRLTALSIENLKAGAVRRKIPDGKGLYLVLQPSGAKSWGGALPDQQSAMQAHSRQPVAGCCPQGSRCPV
jgi:hypothetical protein